MCILARAQRPEVCHYHKDSRVLEHITMGSMFRHLHPLESFRTFEVPGISAFCSRPCKQCSGSTVLPIFDLTYFAQIHISQRVELTYCHHKRTGNLVQFRRLQSVLEYSLLDSETLKLNSERLFHKLIGNFNSQECSCIRWERT